MDNIKLFRIDYRLLHWQTGVLWIQKTKANMILVAGDEVAGDEMRKGLIKISAPKTVTTKILSIDEAVAFITSEEGKKFQIELLVDNTADALALIERIPGLDKVNAALMKTAPGKKLLTKYLAVDEKDIDNFKKMIAAGATVECFTVPDEKAVNITKYIN